MTDKRFGEILDEYLRALETGNPPDREALLARHPDIAEELNAALLGVDFVHGAAPRLAPEEDSDAQPGRSLGDYRLLRELGRGGMAVVYEAEQVSLGRRVALKVLPFAAVLDSKHLQRFKNEAMAAAHLRHPNIVPVYGVGCERGVHYYAMQYVEGQSLATAIRDMKGGGTGEGPRTPISSHGSNREPAYIRMAAALGVQAAEALDHAHELGIVHRDVKPGNLLVDLAGTLWVTDFGLAHSRKDVGLTITGELLGTIRYMSPEQALAKRVPIDHRTDVYSLGATLYELLTLEPAFPGDDPHLVIQDIAFREPVAPRRINPALPLDLETVILKAMSKDPSTRYATAQEMADDLGRFLGDRPIEAKRPGPFRRASKWGRRHRALVGAAAGMLLLAVAGLATGTVLLLQEQDRTENEKKQTKAAFDRAEANLALALKALDEVYLDRDERGVPQARGGLTRDILERGLRFYEEFASENADNRDVARLMGDAYYSASLLYDALGQRDRSKEARDRAISIYREVAGKRPEDSMTHTYLGNALWYKGDRDGAILALREAIRLKPDLAMAHSNLGLALADKGDADGAIGEFREAIRLKPGFAEAHCNLGNALRKKGDLNGAIEESSEAIRLKPHLAEAHSGLGIALLDKGDRDGAIGEFREAIRLKPHLAGAHSSLGLALRDKGDRDGAIGEFREAIRLKPDLAEAHSNLGLALAAKGDLDDAIASLREVIRLDPDSAFAHYSLGNALQKNGDLDGAIEEFHEAIRLKPDYATAHSNLGIALRDKGNLDGAIEECLEAIRLDPDLAVAHCNLGLALSAKGDRDGAIEEYRRAIRLKPDYAEAHSNLGNALEAKGDRDGAIEEFREAIRIEPDLAEAHSNLGNALWHNGDLDGAIEEYRHAIRIEPDLAAVHYNLGLALSAKGDHDGAIREHGEAARLRPNDADAHFNLGNEFVAVGNRDGAIAAYREAIRLDPDDAVAHCNLGHVLTCQGRFQEALPFLRRGHEIGSKRPDWAHPSKEWVESAERKAKMEGRLNQMLSGGDRPRDAVERIMFAELLYGRSRHAESARMYADAFAEDAALAEDLANRHRYDAACSAAAAAARGGADAAEWRGRALEWLRADLAAREKAPSGLVAELKHWKRDRDLAGVRDCLDELPEPEREAWRTLWAAVDRALAAARPAAE